MDRGREIIDGLWMIRQDAVSFDIITFYCGRIAKIENCDRLLTLEDLLKRLMVNREVLKNE